LRYICSENGMILTSAVLSQYTRVTDDDSQTTSYENGVTCNAMLCTLWLYR